MSRIPADLMYSKTHEWVRHLPDGIVEVGITDHAQHSIGQLVAVDLPAVGRQVACGEAVAVTESNKVASDLYSPLACEIILGNPLLAEEPTTVNLEPYGDGWLFRARPVAGGATVELLDAAAYEEFLMAGDG
ncbi:glycine cleavage system protein H [Kitasatospora griseola]|uniref:glycine cleavage system protein H n=1 Tax=Kitasatospora griseola TaxID=2064 RepID=UPI0037FFE0C6